MASFGHQFDLHDVIYHNRRHNVDFTTIGRQFKTCKNTSFSLTRVAGNSNSLFKIVDTLWTMTDSYIKYFCVLESK